VLGPTPLNPASRARSRAELAERLRERRAEIEEAVATRSYALASKTEPHDVTYRQGLRAAISAAIDYGIEVVERGEENVPPTPPLLLAQARLAARFGVGLDTVLRRYSAGYVLLSDFLVEEAGRSGIRSDALRHLFGTQAVLDRLLEAVSLEYSLEQKRRGASREDRLAERIEQLLAGEPIDTSAIAYEFEGHHIGALARGGGAWEALQQIACALECRLLAIRREEGTIWAWLGGRQPIERAELKRHLSAALPPQAILALGEPGEGLSAWRLTHRQAKAALPIARRGSEPLVCYADVAMLAAILKDDLFATSLRQLYLEPLKAERDGGEAARETLRAYFAAESNVSSAAAALGVNRNTVASRLRAIEAAIGRPLSSCGPELEVALRFAELGEPAARR
jgi:hypothetical protein